ncbi:MAG: molybdenum cofactor guanylyltransferase [Crocinitomicaceae bacterium]|nr:molybdenum cofactor guanylyltransferase [Crocinitomicaceae bacterium]
MIILAGGKSSRMGEDKGLMALFGKPMIAYVLDKAKEISEDIIIVSDNDNYKKFGYKVVRDLYKGLGPLSGILSGLTKSDHAANLILSCDIPYIKSGLLNYLIEHSEGYDITVPVHKERIHPLIGVYHKSCIDTIEKNIKMGKLKITDIFDHFNVHFVETDQFEDIEFKNLNSKKDILPM